MRLLFPALTNVIYYLQIFHGKLKMCHLSAYNQAIYYIFASGCIDQCSDLGVAVLFCFSIRFCRKSVKNEVWRIVSVRRV